MRFRELWERLHTDVRALRQERDNAIRERDQLKAQLATVTGPKPEATAAELVRVHVDRAKRRSWQQTRAQLETMSEE